MLFDTSDALIFAASGAILATPPAVAFGIAIGRHRERDERRAAAKVVARYVDRTAPLDERTKPLPPIPDEWRR